MSIISNTSLFLKMAAKQNSIIFVKGGNIALIYIDNEI